MGNIPAWDPSITVKTIYFQRKQKILQNKIHDDKFTHAEMSANQKPKKQVGCNNISSSCLGKVQQHAGAMSKEPQRVGSSKTKLDERIQKGNYHKV